jgi:hypothetical protein
MPILTSEVVHRLSGGAANANANTSLGGAKSSVAAPGNVFDDVSGAESSAGDTEYRCIYVHNANPTLTLQNAVVWLVSNTAGNRISIGVGSSAINGTEQTVANEDTAPAGVTFSQPSTKGAGLSLGSIPPGQHRAVWIRRTVAASTGAVNDSYQLRAEGDTAA